LVKSLTAWFLLTSFLLPGLVRAEVILRLDDGVRLHAIDGAAYSNPGILSGKPRLSLADGRHQVVVDYQAEIGRSRDEVLSTIRMLL
jgi:uncharacterized protein YccT (UPF0319 family)